jgi:predicted  nucleic acid-binding Zn-ribbon protein
MQEKLLMQLVDLVQNLTMDMQVIKQDIQTLKQDVSMLKQEVQMLKQDIETLKQKMDKNEQDIHSMKMQMDEHIKMLNTTRDNPLEQRSFQDEMMHEIAHIRREMATKEASINN